MSEFVIPSVAPDGLKNASDGRAVPTSRMFHDASPASSHPPLSVNRGSGFGAVDDVSIIRAEFWAPSPEDEARTVGDPAAASVRVSPRMGSGPLAGRRVWHGE